MSINHPITIAIDGYSSSGKSTMAKTLARTLGYRYIDSGAMYRAVTLAAMRSDAFLPGPVLSKRVLLDILPDIHVDFSSTPEGQITLLNGEPVEKEIRSMEVSKRVSLVAEVAEVRHRLVALQKAYGEEGGIVMDGRDIGTAVFPDAEMKVFVTASPEHRAKRRYRELLDKGVDASYDEVLANIQTRDHIDETRTESPLRKAPDAHVLDNSEMTLEQQNEWLIRLFHKIVD